MRVSPQKSMKICQQKFNRRVSNENAGHYCPLGHTCGEKSDEQILAQARENKDCFVYIMVRYEEKIKKYVRRISGLPIEAVEDLTQDIFMKIYIHLDEFDTNQKFSSWIYRIAHNETINYWLYAKRRKMESWDANEAVKSLLKDDRDIENEIYQKINNEKLLEAFKVIQEKYRSVLVMNYLEGKSYREISHELDKPIATIGTLLNRGKKLLKKELIKAGLTAESAFQF